MVSYVNFYFFLIYNYVCILAYIRRCLCAAVCIYILRTMRFFGRHEILVTAYHMKF
jgi:hypothetical protein